MSVTNEFLPRVEGKNYFHEEMFHCSGLETSVLRSTAKVRSLNFSNYMEGGGSCRKVGAFFPFWQLAQQKMETGK